MHLLFTRIYIAEQDIHHRVVRPLIQCACIGNSCDVWEFGLGIFESDAGVIRDDDGIVALNDYIVHELLFNKAAKRVMVCAFLCESIS